MNLSGKVQSWDLSLDRKAFWTSLRAPLKLYLRVSLEASRWYFKMIPLTPQRMAPEYSAEYNSSSDSNLLRRGFEKRNKTFIFMHGFKNERRNTFCCFQKNISSKTVSNKNMDIPSKDFFSFYISSERSFLLIKFLQKLIGFAELSPSFFFEEKLEGHHPFRWFLQ